MVTEKSESGGGVDQEKSTARTEAPASRPLCETSKTVEREATRFMRDAYAMWTPPTPNALYVAHSVPSRRNSADGVTLKEIVKDHRAQAEADGGTPLLQSEIVEALFVAIAIGLVKAMPGEAQ